MDEEILKQIFTAAGILLLVLVIFPLYRVIVGPTAIDRIVAVNVIGTKTAVLLVIIGEIHGRVDMFIDFALAYAMLNFIGSIAAARYFFKVRKVSTHIEEGPAHEH